MCGRLVRDGDGAAVYSYFEVNDIRCEWTRSFNIAPTLSVPVVVSGENGRSVIPAIWDLIPDWAVRNGKKRLLHNARAETIHALPSFAPAFQFRRCLVLATGYYEWRKSDRQPFYFCRKDGHPLGFAGIWERDAAGTFSTAIVTTRPNADAGRIHDRMPVILESGAWSRWLHPEPLSAAERHEILVPAPDGSIRGWAVGRAVGNVRNNSSALTVPVDDVLEPTETPDLFDSLR